MLRDEDRVEIKKRLEGMVDPVKLVFFTQQLAGTCMTCSETERLLKEVAELSDKIELEVLNFVTDKEAVEAYGIDKIPATVIMGKEDVGLKFYGIPTGYEFATFLDAILNVSRDESGLDDALKTQAAGISNPVHIQVFVTPTCPYCTRAALTSYQIAMESDQVTASVVEVTEFPQLAQKYSVMGVPKVVINESHSFEGALPEDAFMEHVLNAADGGTSDTPE